VGRRGPRAGVGDGRVVEPRSPEEVEGESLEPSGSKVDESTVTVLGGSEVRGKKGKDEG